MIKGKESKEKQKNTSNQNGNQKEFVQIIVKLYIYIPRLFVANLVFLALNFFFLVYFVVVAKLCCLLHSQTLNVDAFEQKENDKCGKRREIKIYI